MSVAFKTSFGGNVGHIESFKVKANSNAFNAMTASLYSDKPQAVIREYWFNALDAQWLNGNQHLTPEFKLPTQGDANVTIRDFGPGLSTEDIYGLFTTMFASTKTGTIVNGMAVVGKFGCGSKAAFAVSKKFIVTSWHEGTKRIFLCYINEDDSNEDDDGMPKVLLMAEEASDEPSGLQIQVPVQPSERSSYTEAAKQVFKRVANAPEGYNKMAYRVQGKHFALHKDPYYYNQNATAVMGQVAYRIDRNVFGSNITPIQRIFLNTACDLFFEIGEVKPATSREALEYDAKTRAAILAKIDLAAIEMKQMLISEFKDIKTDWDAHLVFSQLVGKYAGLREILQKLPLWKDLPIKPGFAINGKINYGAESKIRLATPKMPEVFHSVIHAKEDTKVYVVTEDVKKDWRRRVIYSWAGGMKCPSQAIILIDDVEKRLAEMGNPPTVMVNTLDLPPFVKTQSGPKTKVKIKKLYNGGWINADVVIEEGGYYIRSLDGVAQTTMDMNSFMHTWHNAGLPAFDKPIYAVPGTFKTLPDKWEGWTPLKDHVTKVISEVVNAPSWVLKMSAHKALYNGGINHTLRWGLFGETTLWKDEDLVSPKGLMAHALQARATYLSDSRTKLNAEERIAYWVGIIPELPEFAMNFTTLSDNLLTTYPLLKHYETGNHMDFVRYINLIDKE